MFSRIRTFAPVFLIALAIVAAGCSVSPDKSKAFVQMAKRVQALEENQKKTVATVDTISYDLETVERDILGLKANLADAAASGQTGPELGEALKRVEQLERKVKDLNAQLGKQTKVVESMGQQVKKNATKATKASTSAKPAAKPRKASTRKSSRPTRLSDVPRRQATGFYYQVSPGDTLHSIARRYNQSSANLCRVNNIPVTAPLYPGQSIYVPRL